MPGWTQLWTRVRATAGFARSLRMRTQTFIHRLYDHAVPTRWLRAHRRHQYARAMQCVRAAFDSPRRRALMLSATGAYKTANGNDDSGNSKNDFVTDEELQELVEELKRTEELTQATLYCAVCSKRLLIHTKRPNIEYCKCDNGKSYKVEEYDGWLPYVETQDAIIWRKEYKKGQGLYAYKVYGRYSEVNASDFTHVQTDCSYRRAWDSAVAALSTVERCHRGVPDQAVIHWEVMWPRLFANRDYVYVRRHKEYFVPKQTFFDRLECPLRKRINNGIQTSNGKVNCNSDENEKPNSNSNDNGKANGNSDGNDKPNGNSNGYDKASGNSDGKSKPNGNRNGNDNGNGNRNDNGYINGNGTPSSDSNGKSLRFKSPPTAKRKETDSVMVIVSKSCEHHKVPETKNAIRVTEYWSHMVIRTLNGVENDGMEFVLTYYDEPAVGGMPAGVATWAAASAVPDYLARMRTAATQYRAWLYTLPQQEEDYEGVKACDEKTRDGQLREEDMESSKHGPIMEQDWRDESVGETVEEDTKSEPKAETTPQVKQPVKAPLREQQPASKVSCEEGSDRGDEEDPRGWWRYLHPLYYFA